MEKIRIFNIIWSSLAGGASNEPDGRTELFFAGCKIGEEGTPCLGCFNEELWYSDHFVAELPAADIVEHIKKHTDKRQITIVGGEPVDQINGLADLCKELKKNGFHILLFTHYTKKELFDKAIEENNNAYYIVLNNIDILIDGVYKKEEHIYDESINDGFHNAVGSGNQIIWDMQACPPRGIAARDLERFIVCEDNSLRYVLKQETR